MSQAQHSTVPVQEQEALQFAQAVLQSVGATEEHARVTAENLIFADRSGIASHGLLRLPLYADAVHHGGINAAPEMTWVRQEPGGGLLEADGAFGQVAMAEAVRYAAEQLGRAAAAVVSVQGSSHFGAGAYWVDRLAAEGFIGIVTSTTGPVVTPFGGGKKVLGTNPLSMSFPTADEHPMTVDMATSTGAYGKVVAARNAGTEVPAGWAVDPEGKPTTDPEKALAGALTPFGGHKGSGLSIALEGLSAALAHASFAYETEDIWINPASRMNVGHTLIAINPESFAGAEHTRQRFSELRREVRGSGDNVFAPGDIEAGRRAAGGDIELASSTVDLLNAAAERWDVAPITAHP